jgi:FdhE protein
MKQGEAPPRTGWIGNPQGGVATPAPILAPDPDRLFARRAARLAALAPGHPMQAWLMFMACLGRAQMAALAALQGLDGVDPVALRQAVEGGLPPLAAAGHAREPAWRDGLHRLLAAFDHAHSPEQARRIALALQERSAQDVEALADAALDGDAQEAGAQVYVAAALQVYFAAQAALLPATSLRLLPERGLCPCCGSTPIAGVVTAGGATPGVRYLHCSLCATAWNHARAICVSCGGSRSLSLKTVEGDSGAAKAETCGECGCYLKMFYEAKDPAVEPVADDLATLGLDLLVGEDGAFRRARNPLLPG